MKIKQLLVVVGTFLFHPEVVLGADAERLKLVELIKLSLECPGEPFEIDLVTKQLDTHKYTGDSDSFELTTTSTQFGEGNREKVFIRYVKAPFSQLSKVVEHNGELIALCKNNKLCTETMETTNGAVRKSMTGGVNFRGQSLCSDDEYDNFKSALEKLVVGPDRPRNPKAQKR